MLGGKVALITGGAQEIGAGKARTMASQGARVALLDLDAAEAEKTAGGLSTPAMVIACDVTIETDVAPAVQTIVERFGGLDTLVNKLGTARAESHLTRWCGPPSGRAVWPRPSDRERRPG
jgi:NAD(P)-dependent dehydrogenase (short-subunit alcohol dehydrogenase family)